MATIAENLQVVKARIARAAREARRDPQSVILLAVSKTHPIAAIDEARRAGQHAFGENYVQDAAPKIAALPGLEWHLIGPLQSNKTREAAERFAWIQTVDRGKIAQRLSAQRSAAAPALNVLVQVNVSQEASKAGVLPRELRSFVSEVAALPRLRLRGLMAIPAPGVERDFERMKSFYDELRDEFGFDTLSMGMSDDLEAAIAHGSTMVRVGTAIFGERRPRSVR
jgi:PLP dependent protein